MSKWDTINEGGEGYRPTAAKPRSALQIECEISDQYAKIASWEFSSDTSAASIISAAKAKIAELSAELASLS